VRHLLIPHHHLRLSLARARSQLLGAPERRPQVDLCVVHHLEGIVAEEQTLDHALVIDIGVVRPPVIITEVRLWLWDSFNILEDSFKI
jgi:hypothetical protein